MNEETELIIHIPEGESEAALPGFDANLPADVRYNKNLSPMAKIFYCEIRALSSKHGFCWAKNSYFQKVFDVEDRSIRNWIKELEAEELIVVFKARNDVNGKVYRIIKIAGSKIRLEKRKKISEKSGKKFPEKPEKNFRHVINKSNNKIYNRARARDNTTQSKSKASKTNFQNFSQREYDFDALESKIINRPLDKDEGAGCG